MHLLHTLLTYLKKIKLSINVGDTPIEITWSFAGHSNLSTHLGLKTALIGTRTSMLLVDPVIPGNSGIYTVCNFIVFS